MTTAPRERALALNIGEHLSAFAKAVVMDDGLHCEADYPVLSVRNTTNWDIYIARSSREGRRMNSWDSNALMPG